MLFAVLRPLAWLAIHLLYRLFGGIRFEGRECVPRKGGVLITPNHISDADPPTVGIALPRACYFMAKEELFDIRVLGKLIRLLHGFPVKRYSADRTALRLAETLLKQGECVVIFPEGKLSEDGKLQPLLPGALLVAKGAKTPIVPTVIIGTDRIMPYGVTVPRRAKGGVIVRFGPPVTVAELTGGVKGGEALKDGAERLRAIMLALQEGRHLAPGDVVLPPKSDDTTDESKDEKSEIEVAEAATPVSETPKDDAEQQPGGEQKTGEVAETAAAKGDRPNAPVSNGLETNETDTDAAREKTPEPVR